MNDQIIRLYVTAPDGRYLPSIGPRAYGEYFDLPETVVQELAQQHGFSLDDPAASPAGDPVKSRSKKHATDHEEG